MASLHAAPRRPADIRLPSGIVALCLVTLLIGGAALGLVTEAAGNWSNALAAFDAYLLRVVRFTLWQAVLSTILSVGPAILVARALWRHPDFPGRYLMLRLFALPLALPAIVAALGILALLGRAGYVAELAQAIGFGQWPGIYGLSGILIAHVFFNLPLASRLFLHALESIPADQSRLAAQLGMGARESFRFVEWPALRAALPGVAGLVFMLCITSFTLVLTLGGGPAATTLEVAIYQSLRFDFDPARAVALTALQVALTIGAAAVLVRLGSDLTGDASLSVATRRPIQTGTAERVGNALVLTMVFLFVAAPLATVLASGLRADLWRLAGENSVQTATLTSLTLALVAASLAVVLSTALVMARRAAELGHNHALSRLFEAGASYVLVVPPIVIGAGWFMLLRHSGSAFALAPLMVVIVNAVMAMPFVVRAIRPAHDAASARHERLSAQLGISGWTRFRLIDWPAIRKPAMTGFAFAMALSLGDLGVIALFGSDSVQTLPYLLLARMGSYRTADAAGLALLLGILCLVLIMLAERWGRGRND